MKKQTGTWKLNSTLKGLLMMIPNNKWDWYIYELSGIVEILPEGYDSIDQLENEIISSKYGKKVSWEELLQFGAIYKDVYDCIIVAADQYKAFDDIQKKNFNHCYVYLEVFDNSAWEIILFN